MGTELEIPPAPSLEVCGFCHGERCREAHKKVAVVLAIGHTLRTHEALGSPDALPGFLEVVHCLVKYGVFADHDRSIRARIIRSLGCLPSPAITPTGPLVRLAQSLAPIHHSAWNRISRKSTSTIQY
jgi:hypothetical protein